MRRLNFGYVIAALALVGVLGITGALIIGKHDLKQLTQQHSETADLERRVLAWVVERNPNATIKDFSDFPRVLIETSARAGLDFRLVLAMCDKESEMNPHAVSSAGAIGLCQVMPGTGDLMAKRLGITDYKPPIRDGKGGYKNLGSLGDPKINLVLGVEYLKIQVEKFGAGATALRAYNRRPADATASWPRDRYAEDVSLGFVTLAHTFPERR